MNIFEALRESHENQRNLSEQLIQTHGLTEERKELFDALKNELYAHSVAEDRYLYIPLMFDDVGLDITRHALSEHHEMDELVEQLEKTDMSSPSWLATAKQLSEKVHHHLKEEEHKFFQQAGKILKDSEKETLGNKYLGAVVDKVKYPSNPTVFRAVVLDSHS
ncbi:hemerythrin domain-containing protein [Acinetobacter baumannii]|nr:hemerythrin domain-containing protein [Acinetobacter baumannii]UMO12083.1 hemerythrin domain-containing protein [Acinetobacter baumannii]